MKGIAVWVWVIGGIIVGLTLFASFFQIMSIIVASREREIAKQNIDDIVSMASSFCELGPGHSMDKNFIIPNAVSSIFASDDQRTASLKNNANYGQYLCMKTADSREAYCVKVDCELELEFNVSAKSIGSIFSRIVGKYDYTEYRLTISRTECGVALLAENEDSKVGSCAECDYLPLMQCKDHAIAAYLEPNIVVLTDFTPIYDCCSETTLTFLKNTANFLKGSRVLMIYEQESVGSSLPKNLDGFVVDSYRHTSKITQSKLQNYDQVWILLPGFCSVFDADGKTVECNGIIKWDSNEAGEIKNFANGGGKLLLVSDYTPYTTQTVANDILNQLGFVSRFNDGCSCGCNGSEENVDKIADHPIMQGVTSWTVKAGAEFVC